jgi:sugar (pentulose or hexulose) kinase
MNFLVIDVGTSVCRAAVVSGKGEIIEHLFLRHDRFRQDDHRKGVGESTPT